MKTLSYSVNFRSNSLQTLTLSIKEMQPIDQTSGTWCLTFCWRVE